MCVEGGGGSWCGCVHACVTYAGCRTLVCKLICKCVYASVIGVMVELQHVPLIPKALLKDAS